MLDQVQTISLCLTVSLMMPQSVVYSSYYACVCVQLMFELFGAFDSSVTLSCLQLLELKTKLFNSLCNVRLFLLDNYVFFLSLLVSVYYPVVCINTMCCVLYGVVLFCICAMFQIFIKVLISR